MKATLALFLLLLASMFSPAQNIGIGTGTPHPSAKLDITATDKGVLVPRLTSAQRTAIASPAQGLLVFDSDTGTFWFFNGYAWVNLSKDPLTLPYLNEGTAAVPTFTIVNNGSGAGIRGIGTTGPGLYGWGKGGGLAGVGVRAENTHASGIGVWSTTNSADANLVISNSGTGDLLRGFSGPSAGNLVSRLLNNGTFITSGKVGIGTTAAPSASLEVNGPVKIADGTQGSNKVLTSDASGNASWRNVPANPAATTFFSAEKTGNSSTHQFWNHPDGNHTMQVTFPAAYADAGSNYNTSTSTYTIPTSGYYFFNTRVTLDMSYDGHVWLELHANTSAVAFNHENVSSAHGSLKTVSLSHSGYFPAGIQITVHVTLPPGAIALRSDSEFSGWRVY